MIKMIQKTYVCLLFLMPITGAVSAAIDDKEYARCASIEGDLERLECFDNLAREKKLDGKQAQPLSISGKGKWDVHVEVNPIDDSKTVFLTLKADEGKSKWKRPIYLTARCLSNKTEVYINWDDYLGRKVSMTTRVGNKKAVTSRWGVSSDGKAAFHHKPIGLLKDMMEHNKFVAQVTPYNDSPVTAIFDISGLSNAIAPLRETCNW